MTLAAILPASTVCRSGLHCHHCRDLTAGRAFRRSLIGSDPDFACPSGKLWEFWRPLHRLPGPTPAEFAELLDHLHPQRRMQADEYIAGHPVRWDDFPAWASEFHDRISAAISKANPAQSDRPAV
jgi:hypothetical protein